jgi:hypothetical protein
MQINGGFAPAQNVGNRFARFALDKQRGYDDFAERKIVCLSRL